jgi:hypothetical protein
MKIHMRLLAGMITFSGAALLASPQQAYATMSLDQADPLGTRYCCGLDTDGDRRADTYCCYRSGCTIDGSGCRQVAAS